MCFVSQASTWEKEENECDFRQADVLREEGSSRVV